MKTYWLEGRESRPSLTKVISPQLQPGTELEWERAADVRDSIAEHSAQQMNTKDKDLASGTYAHLPNAVNSGPNSLARLNSCSNLMAVTSSSLRNSQVVTPNPTVYSTVTSPVEERRMYSPVTFQDVAMRSIANSPNRNENRGRFRFTVSTIL